MGICTSSISAEEYESALRKALSEVKNELNLEKTHNVELNTEIQSLKLRIEHMKVSSENMRVRSEHLKRMAEKHKDAHLAQVTAQEASDINNRRVVSRLISENENLKKTISQRVDSQQPRERRWFFF
tara:strand:- start:2992 stop:3372 length:381 start_codon:yes stop_codon:yes gene_type:complete